jgi:murein DD-endopeptidase MepM/ murein hydrolase activator NlpD
MNKYLIFFFGLFFQMILYSQNFNSISYERNYKKISVIKQEKVIKESPLVKNIIIEKSQKVKEIAIDKPTIKKIDLYNNLMLPLDELKITSHYGKRFHPLKSKWIFHDGLDFKANNDTIKSILNGVIHSSGYNKGLGYFVKVKYNDYVVTYGHLSEYFFLKNEFVKAGTPLGITGNTGLSTGEHLHFSVDYKNESINPLDFIKDLVLIDKNLQTFKNISQNIE